MNLLRCLRFLVPILLLLWSFAGSAVAGGPFGTPQPVAKEGGGLHTGIGYWQQEDLWRADSLLETVRRHAYSEVGYSFSNNWEIYARLGIADLKIADGFGSLTPSITVAKNDFEENTNYFGTMGVKVFHPFNRLLGWGVFVQGSYYFRDFADEVTGSQSGVPFRVEQRVSDLWELDLGIALQAVNRAGVKYYCGPFIYYSEAKVRASAAIAGIGLTTDAAVRNRAWGGGFVGVDVPLAKGFRLQIEGQYSSRLSAGTAVTYSY